MNAKRRNDLDWLRVFAVAVLIYFHAAAVFYRGDLGEFYVVNRYTSLGFGLLISIVHQWHMPLFFFISGAASWFALEKRSQQDYIQERVQRLLIPFVFGLFVLVPPQVYLSLIVRSHFQGSYFEFYPQFFNGIRPAGNFEWAHLWFIIYLFVFSIVSLPVLSYLKSANYRINLILLALPLALIEAIFRPRWIGFQNLYDDWANVLLYLTYFIYGYGLIARSQFTEMLDRYRGWIVGSAIGLMSILVGLWITHTVPDRAYSPAYMSYQAFRGVNSWICVLAFLSLGQHYLQFHNSVLNYLNESAYPVYLLHQTILVTIAFFVVRWDIDVVTKFVVISTATIAITLLVYELLVRRIWIMRSLLGLK
ncbi:MAG: acyltransferase [Plectolyngbya sp. WJT66-NPBG17]|jgi:peptidoglycan/LPS O-acetylase OafA/YrhL|nr:acyltransferase [Plectolyngbya sp. WJT66-NPBG17]MBW4523962.1 acyltransferase [Phormidium tanganyikae FI6-MK23]